MVVVLALNVAGWMAFDGTRALVVGDYVTPSSGRHAGQLGPWRHVCEAVGIPPRSTQMKSIFAVGGFAWLAAIGWALVHLRRPPGPPDWVLFGFALGSLWYLPVGTLLSLLQIVLLGVLLGGEVPGGGD